MWLEDIQKHMEREGGIRKRERHGSGRDRKGIGETG